jgi:hypothetical protein
MKTQIMFRCNSDVSFTIHVFRFSVEEKQSKQIPWEDMHWTFPNQVRDSLRVVMKTVMNTQAFTSNSFHSICYSLFLHVSATVYGQFQTSQTYTAYIASSRSSE